MKEKKTIECVVQLLNRFAGTSVVKHWVEDSKLTIQFKCTLMASLARIAFCVQPCANQSLRISAIHGGVWLEVGKPSRGLEFFIEVDLRPNNEPCSHLEIVGICFVWRLYSLKQLSRKEANNLLRAWKGARV